MTDKEYILEKLENLINYLECVFTNVNYSEKIEGTTLVGVAIYLFQAEKDIEDMLKRLDLKKI